MRTHLIILFTIFLTSGIWSQVKLTQIERSADKWFVPSAYRVVPGIPDYHLKYISVAALLDSVGISTSGGISGTTNYVSKFTSSTTIGNSQITDDGTDIVVGQANGSIALKVATSGVNGIDIMRGSAIHTSLNSDVASSTYNGTLLAHNINRSTTHINTSLAGYMMDLGGRGIHNSNGVFFSMMEPTTSTFKNLFSVKNTGVFRVDNLAGSGNRMVIANSTGDLSTQAIPLGTVTGVTASSPLFSSGGAAPNITIQNATTSQNGALTSTDWNTFNNKMTSFGLRSNAGTGAGVTLTVGNGNVVDFVGGGITTVSRNTGGTTFTFSSTESQGLSVGTKTGANVPINISSGTGINLTDGVGTSPFVNSSSSVSVDLVGTANSVKARVGTSSGTLSDVSLSNSQLIGRGSSGNVSAITLGSGLTMSGATLIASAGASNLSFGFKSGARIPLDISSGVGVNFDDGLGVVVDRTASNVVTINTNHSYAQMTYSTPLVSVAQTATSYTKVPFSAMTTSSSAVYTFDDANDRITVAATGLYMVTYKVSIKCATAGTARTGVFIAGSLNSDSVTEMDIADTGKYYSFTYSYPQSITAGQTVQLNTYYSSSSTIDMTFMGLTLTRIW